MIDLTPLDVRNKRGDFRKSMRGYDAQEVDVFLEMVAERLEALVRENIQLRERVESLGQQVSSQTGREQAVHEALVTAQELRADMQSQAQREAKLILTEAETEARRRVTEADAEVRQRLRDAQRKLDQAHDALQELERRRVRFLKQFKQLLAHEMDAVEVEEERPPLEERPIKVDLTPPPPPPEPPAAPAAESASPDASEPAGEGEGEGAGDGGEVEVPLDASVDELAALYKQRAGAEGESGEEPRDEELFLSLEDEAKEGG